ncbi:Sas10/Utp3 family protein [Nannizzia gypsea CBS 118893]|uniref:Sas10/Utp3 family protein n=1 Tax=Arthroderma gypseum (strain ATCC MYA-4604 / CBS 118893) TaxID=535722 RepID=E4UTI4_ARTGP|nr:Sas10/Utp3 family protein [Nannizzia gypsea CBS 118893]EFR01529.1 Sas10/Utp3 family protein [Nannizzia gypsea CBS 118893]
MAKKRKAGGAALAHRSKNPVEDKNSKFAADARFENSEDEFEAGRDRVLLEERPEVKRRRRLEEDERLLQLSDEEVHGYVSESESEDDYDYGNEEEEEVEEKEDKAANLKKKLPKLRRREELSPDLMDDGKKPEEDEEGIEAWGASKSDYYNADTIETEGDALEEEEEAKKIQLKKLQSMTDADFGFDESEWLDSAKGDEEVSKDAIAHGKTITEVLPEIQIPDDMSVEERLNILSKRYPEFVPLSKDYTDLQPRYQELSAAVDGARKSRKETSSDKTPLSVLQFRALAAYLGVISMYFVLLTSPARNSTGSCLALPPAELREHPIMGALVVCRKTWEQVKDLQEVEQEPSDIEEEEEIDTTVPATKSSLDKPSKVAKAAKVPKKSKAQKLVEKAQALAESQRAEKLNKTELGLQELSKLLDQGSSSKLTSQRESQLHDYDSDFGDETKLTAHEAAEKAKKKKSLRFYTSQIAQKANKRDAAGRHAGGDTDLPYKERNKDRQARLNEEAQKRGRMEANENERLGGDSDEEDYQLAREVRGDMDGSNSDDYYDMVSSRQKQKKADKKALSEARALAAKEGGRVEIQEEIGPDGKRAITYAIEKNKGLTPKRNKDVRNPRVKKRKKFEAKKKKLGSIKQIYKGGEGRGGYGGELTGIKKNLVKSVKL